MKQPGYIGWMDELRGIAVLMVVVYHALFWTYGQLHYGWNEMGIRSPSTGGIPWYFAPFTLGWGGVAIFFVISGFCIHLSHQRTGLWKDFFIKRFWRIYPPYAFAMVAFFCSDLLLNQISFHGTGSQAATKQLVTHALLIHNLSSDTLYGINPSFWSIAIEWQLYLIYPLLVFGVARFGWLASLVTALACEVALQLAISRADIYFDLILKASPFAYWFSWSLGAWLAQLYRENKIPGSRWFLSPPLFCLLFAVCWLWKPLASLCFLAVALFSFSVIVRKLGDSKKPRNSMISGLLSYCGTVSYSLYLLHQPIISLTHKILSRFDGYVGTPPEIRYFLLVFFSLVASMAAASVFYYTIEKWSMNFGRRLAQTPSMSTA
jgi:peptidoglycan/LPS O-acetylase OafA/YrhL